MCPMALAPRAGSGPAFPFFIVHLSPDANNCSTIFFSSALTSHGRRGTTSSSSSESPPVVCFLETSNDGCQHTSSQDAARNPLASPSGTYLSPYRSVHAVDATARYKNPNPFFVSFALRYNAAMESYTFGNKTSGLARNPWRLHPRHRLQKLPPPATPPPLETSPDPRTHPHVLANIFPSPPTAPSDSPRPLSAAAESSPPTRRTTPRVAQNPSSTDTS